MSLSQGFHRDPRDHGARLWDALVTSPSTPSTPTAVPDSHGTRTRLVVTLDHHTLIARPRKPEESATTADGLDLPPDVVRRLACDAEIIPAVLGTHGEVLDVGRTRTTVTSRSGTPWWSATDTAPSPAATDHR